MDLPERLRRHADALHEAERSRKAIEPLRLTDPELTIADAYAIQEHNVRRRLAGGARIRGRKVGLTSRPMQRLLGVDEPDFGALLDGMVHEHGDPVDVDALLAPKVEAELAFVMDRPLRGPGVLAADAARAIAGVLPAIEVIDSRIAGWDIQLVDTVADNASCGRVVLGDRLVAVDGLDLPRTGMALRIGGDVVATGAGAAVLGDPLRAVAWLANKLSEFGEELREGDVVMSGSLHAAVDAAPGALVRAEFNNIGSVATRFAEAG